MAKIRRAGFGTVFNIENEKVGIGTTGKFFTEVRVLKNLELSDANVVTQAQLENYQGFLSNETRLSGNDVDLNKLVGYVKGEAYYGESHAHTQDDGTVVNMVGSAHTTFSHNVIDDSSNIQSGAMGDIIIDGEFTVSSGTTYCSSVDQLTCVDNFTVPTGNTDDRIHCHTAGSMRFNEDLGTLEFYTGDMWKTVNSFKDTGNRGRAVFTTNAGGNKLDFVNIPTLGNATFFGSLTNGNRQFGCASETRGLWAGGYNPSTDDSITYITIASEGDSIDFGDLNEARRATSAASSSTRGVWFGGYSPAGGGASNRTNTIQYVEIATLGNAKDFGDLTSTNVSAAAGASPTRCIFSGGYTSPFQYEVITTASTGNATRFGDMLVPMARHAGCSNSIRGVFGGGRAVNPYGVVTAELEYITIASEGNATFFGDLTEKRNMLAAASNQTRGLFAGGYFHPSNSGSNRIDFITFSSTGNAIDFGDCIEEKRGVSGLSDSHGGLGGF